MSKVWVLTNYDEGVVAVFASEASAKTYAYNFMSSVQAEGFFNDYFELVGVSYFV